MTEEKLERRQFIERLSLAGIAGAVGMLPFESSARNLSDFVARPEEGHVFLSAPYLQQPSEDGMTIRWISNKLSYSWVEYGETQQLGNKAHQVRSGLIYAYNRINEVKLSGLKPGTRYYYKVFSKEITEFHPYKLTYGEVIASDLKTFDTVDENAQDVSWLVMNDIHDRPYSIPHLMGLNKDDYNFVFFNGDMFDYQTDEQQIIDHMIKPCADSFASTIPFMFVRGNHETRGKFARDLEGYFTNTDNRFYYSFRRGPVHFTVLDTGEDKADDAPVYAGIVDFDAYREEQAKWVEKEMQTPAFRKAKFRVVMMHIPHFYSGDWHGTMHCRKLFAPLFEKYKIDLFLAGHTHKYGVHEPVAGDHGYPIVIGGGPKEGARTLIKVRANKKELNLSMLADDGKEVGKYQLLSKR